MTKTTRTAAANAMTDAVLDLFRLSNQLATAGDRLVADHGLTSARWQVLGTIVASARPQPVSWLARDMSANRQNVQRIVNDLEKEGLVELLPNPHHRRARLVALTEAGEKAYDEAMALQSAWMNQLTEGLGVTQVKTAHEVIISLRRKLEEEAAADSQR